MLFSNKSIDLIRGVSSVEKSFQLDHLVQIPDDSCDAHRDQMAGIGYCALFECDTVYQFQKDQFQPEQVERYIDSHLNSMGSDALDKVRGLLSESLEDQAGDFMGQELLHNVRLSGIRILRSPYDTHDLLFGAAIVLQPPCQREPLELLVLGNQIVGISRPDACVAERIWHSHRKSYPY